MTKRYKNFDSGYARLIEQEFPGVIENVTVAPPTKKEIAGAGKFTAWLVDHIDSIGGSHIIYDGKMIWFHFPDQIEEWVVSQLDSWKEDY
jgi:hypothetical protein